LLPGLSIHFSQHISLNSWICRKEKKHILAYTAKMCKYLHFHVNYLVFEKLKAPNSGLKGSDRILQRWMRMKSLVSRRF